MWALATLSLQSFLRRPLGGPHRQDHPGATAYCSEIMSEPQSPSRNLHCLGSPLSLRRATPVSPQAHVLIPVTCPPCPALAPYNLPLPGEDRQVSFAHHGSGVWALQGRWGLHLLKAAAMETVCWSLWTPCQGVQKPLPETSIWALFSLSAAWGQLADLP